MKRLRIALLLLASACQNYGELAATYCDRLDAGFCDESDGGTP